MKMYNPPYPGKLISETLEALGIGIREFARALNIAPATAHRILNGISVITPEMAVKLAVVLGSSPKFWLNLQDNYSLFLAEKNVDVTGLNRLIGFLHTTPLRTSDNP